MQGKYAFKLLAVDVPSAAGGEQRVFLDGSDQIYARGGVMSELRDPFVRVTLLPLTLQCCTGQARPGSRLERMLQASPELPLSVPRALVCLAA